MFDLDTAIINCPYCGERIELVLDLSVETQRYIEDCSVCCRPIQLMVEVTDRGDASVTPSSEDDC